MSSLAIVGQSEAHIQKLHIAIPSSTELVGPVVSFFNTLFKNKDFDDALTSDIVTAIIEALANAITHGNHGDVQKKVDILAYVDDISVCIEVQDEGEGFNVDAVPDPLAPENLMKPSGRGIFLIRSFMDNVIFDFQGKGTHLIMEKYLTNNTF
jgi:serine/threonine-protein kinase RsbW